MNKHEKGLPKISNHLNRVESQFNGKEIEVIEESELGFLNICVRDYFFINLNHNLEHKYSKTLIQNLLLLQFPCH